MTEAILQTARSLSADSYRTFVLSYGYGLSVADIAQELHIERDAVKVRLVREPEKGFSYRRITVKVPE